MSGVNYHTVIDRLTDAIKELNQSCVAEAPAVPAERTAEERKQDAAIVLRELLHALEGRGAGAAAAEHGASAEKQRVFANAGAAGVSFRGASGLGAGASSAMPKPPKPARPPPQEGERDFPPGVTTGFCGSMLTCFTERPYVLTPNGYAKVTKDARNGFCAHCNRAFK